MCGFLPFFGVSTAASVAMLVAIVMKVMMTDRKRRECNKDGRSLGGDVSNRSERLGGSRREKSCASHL